MENPLLPLLLVSDKSPKEKSSHKFAPDVIRQDIRFDIRLNVRLVPLASEV